MACDTSCEPVMVYNDLSWYVCFGMKPCPATHSKGYTNAAFYRYRTS